MKKKMIKSLIIAGGILLLVVGGILAVIFGPASCNNTATPDEFDPGIDMSLHINEDGLHTATIHLNEDGEIENNSYGTLMNYIPSQVSKIVVKNPEGNYTFLSETPVNADGTTEATVYTLEGFEDFELAGTNPALLANAVSAIDFVKVADLTGDNAADYGFDAPRAEATVYYSDDTHSLVRLGDNAPDGTHCYIQFGDNNTVYVAKIEDMEPMLFTLTDMFSTAINGDATSIADDSFDKIVLGGTHLTEKIEIIANKDAALGSYYLMSSHGNAPVNTVEGSAVTGCIKSLTAEEVVCVNPDSSQLETYGLADPYATVSTNYSYEDIQYDLEGNVISNDTKVFSVALLASKADSDGYVYLMEKDGKIIYKILAENVTWATTSMEKLTSEYVWYPAYNMLDTVTVEADGKSYTFNLSSEEVETVDEDGNATTATQVTVDYNGKTMDEGQFYVLFQDLGMMPLNPTEDSLTAGDELMKVTFGYQTDRADDTIVYYATDSQMVLPKVNGTALKGYVYSADITGITENISDFAEGVEISSVIYG
ncbi:MAG: DUF4340 domain-containing protein [Ruminococcus sp.]|nr:DUF4340 domain-containing protein [Ruminococcus sp.]